MKLINSDKAPKAIGPYSAAVKQGNLIFTSGQIGVDPVTNMLVGEDISKQASQAMDNLRAVLESAGSSMEKALKVTVYLKSMDDFGMMNEIYAKYFTGKPARTTVQVAKLPKDAKIEIDVISYCD
jgi:2-iminobutanoate/2-iminopropanoate deaminase